jgi:hypothetical protein
MRELVRYWQPDDDWRKCEAGLNALPHSSPQSMGSTFTSFMSARTYECLAGHHHARLARIAQGAKSFAESWQNLLSAIESKGKELQRVSQYACLLACLGSMALLLTEALAASLKNEDLAANSGTSPAGGT